jgi:putative PEP-CTERM system histidine kinase
MLEQLFRNTSAEHRWALKYLWIGIFSMFAYDFYLYSNALLYQRISNELWNARGFIHAMAVPLIGVAIRREMRWSLSKDAIDVYISRHALFHTTTLIAAGLYMLVMGVGGYYVREYGGSWGAIAQAMFLFASVLVLVVLLFSGKVRARLKVFLDKHFFHYKYDYREEWLRIIRTLSVSNETSRLQERAIRALAQIIDSPAGMLWLKRDNGRYEPEESWNMEKISAREQPDSTLVRFLEEQQFVISVDEYRATPEMYTRLGTLDIPPWLDNIRNAWLVVPLMLNDSLLGFVVLAHSPSHQNYYNWEDSDLLKTSGRQVASTLAQYLAAKALADAKRFEEMNRLSAFVVHDLKNMIGQLSMVVSNAAKHKHNPMFMEDAISTIENSVNKMNSLLSRLRGGGTGDNVAVFNVCQLLEETVRTSSKSGVLPIPVLNCQFMEANIIADRERMAANIAHLIQNARDATDEDGRITVRLRRVEGFAIIEIEDTGCGMDEDFIREKLFKPFVSTKGTMGIGVYQVREYVYKLGGDMEVQSKQGTGTTFRLHIPLAASDANTRRPQLVQL